MIFAQNISLMPQSLSQLYIHLVFATKNRENTIPKSTFNDLYSYIGGIMKGMECVPLRIGGTEDHVHILFILNKNISLVDCVKTIKANTSRWIKMKSENDNFSWQDGYGAFSVSQSQIEKVTNYIENQEEHHRKKTWKEELEAFFKAYNVKYDERYL